MKNKLKSGSKIGENAMIRNNNLKSRNKKLKSKIKN